MSVAQAAIFGIIVIGGAVGMDYYLYTQQNAALDGMGAVPHTSYFDSVSQRIGSAVETASDTVLPAGHDLTTFLAAAPEGWTRAAYTEADGEAVTGFVFQRKPFLKSSTDGTLSDLAKTRDTGRNVTDTYTMGDAKVIVHVSYRAPKTNKSFTGKIDEMVQGNMEGFTLSEPMPPFGTVQGVSFRQLSMTDRDQDTGEEFELTYRRLAADLGKAVDILVVTNADDAAVQAILTGMDLPGLAAIAGIQDGLVRADLAPVWGEVTATAVDETAPVQDPAPTQEAAVTEETRSKVCIRRAGVLECG